MNNDDVLVEMLEIACGLLNENEICSCCVHNNKTPDCGLCNTDDYCKDGIFEGLKAAAKDNIRKLASMQNERIIRNVPIS